MAINTGSTLTQNLVPQEPHLKDLLDLHRKQILLNLSCHHIGTIESFNSDNQTAVVTLNYKKTFFQTDPQTGLYTSTLSDYPPLTDCPVICLGGGMGALTFPIQKGDECLCLFNDRDMDNWFSGGSGGANATGRLHSFTDAIILVGLRSLSHILTDYDMERVVLKNGTTSVSIGETLIKIANEATTLNTLLQSLITNVKNLVSATAAITVPVTTAPGTSGPPVNAGTITAIGSALTTLGNQIGELLE